MRTNTNAHPFRQLIAVLLTSLFVSALPSSANAQVALVHPATPSLPIALAPFPILKSAVRLAREETMARDESTHDSNGGRKSAIGWGAAIGLLGGAVATAYAAQSYGENEGGKFCTGCFVQWGAIALPVGAGIGALVGLAIDAVRR